MRKTGAKRRRLMAVRMTASTSAARRRANGFAAFRGPSLSAEARLSRKAAARSSEAGRGGAWDALIWIERAASPRGATAETKGAAKSGTAPGGGATVETSSGGRKAAGKASRKAEPARGAARFLSASWNSSEADIPSGPNAEDGGAAAGGFVAPGTGSKVMPEGGRGATAGGGGGRAAAAGRGGGCGGD